MAILTLCRCNWIVSHQCYPNDPDPPVRQVDEPAKSAQVSYIVQPCSTLI